MARPALIILGVVLVIGIIVAIVLGVSYSRGSDASTKEGPKDTPADESIDLTKPKSPQARPQSDPTEAEYDLSILAIGDWGATMDKPGSCCNKYRKVALDSVDYKTDYFSQKNIAHILSLSANELKPKAIIGHGDNLYWNGPGPGDIENRMEKTFEEVYSAPSLQGIPWYNVLGNHDYGGSDFICGEEDYQFRPCRSTEELLKYLDLKYSLQANYRSPNQDRWKLRGHYYKESIEENGISVDIFNIDTNYADSHGYTQICCQCFGYNRTYFPTDRRDIDCDSIVPGDKYCAGGDIEMFNACANRIQGWWDESMEKVQADLAESTATFKIINSHYSPHFHMSVPKMTQWFEICQRYNVTLWLNGHTHGFNHDIGKFGTHFVENGGGGGIQSETSGQPPPVAQEFLSNQWIAAGAPYGYFELSFSKDWAKLQFVTFDDQWTFSTRPNQIVRGGLRRDYCYYIPVTGGEGVPCTQPKN